MTTQSYFKNVKHSYSPALHHDIHVDFVDEDVVNQIVAEQCEEDQLKQSKEIGRASCRERVSIDV